MSSLVVNCLNLSPMASWVVSVSAAQAGTGQQAVSGGDEARQDLCIGRRLRDRAVRTLVHDHVVVRHARGGVADAGEQEPCDGVLITKRAVCELANAGAGTEQAPSPPMTSQRWRRPAEQARPSTRRQRVTAQALTSSAMTEIIVARPVIPAILAFHDMVEELSAAALAAASASAAAEHSSCCDSASCPRHGSIAPIDPIPQ